MLQGFLRLLFIVLPLASAQADEYLMQQRWENLLMVHWEVPAEELRKHIPRELELLTFKGKAYVGAVSLDMARGNFVAFGDLLAEFPLYRPFGQLNLRTYVSYRGRRGVHFFNIFADHRTTVATGNLIFGLPYQYARITRSFDGHQRAFQLNHAGADIFKTRAVVQKRPEAFSRDSLEYFLTEHTLYFQVKKTGLKTCIHSGELWHRPWELAAVDVKTDHFSYFARRGLALALKPIATGLFTSEIDVFFYAPQKVCH